ncbi:MAG: MBL fold metallo-hydrolase [Candidatus Nealsonbacteria bacterium]|nr:MBL fold metallo-hydrolase [Candidatus Nealsonbacteria bacterium]
MQMFWKGQSCFQILAGQIKIVIDPFSEEAGLRLPKLEADVLLITHTHEDHNNIKAVGGSPFLIQGPGEYEVKGVYVKGIPSFHDDKEGKERGNNTIYMIEVEDLKICHLGDLGQKELTKEQMEEIGEIDVLMLPVGGIYTISAKEALNIMSQVEPKVTIPMHYALPKLKYKLEGVDKFLKILGIKSIAPEEKLTIKKKDMSEEEARVVVLNP